MDPGATERVGVVPIFGSTALVTIPTRVWIADATLAHKGVEVSTVMERSKICVLVEWPPTVIASFLMAWIAISLASMKAYIVSCSSPETCAPVT